MSISGANSQTGPAGVDGMIDPGNKRFVVVVLIRQDTKQNLLGAFGAFQWHEGDKRKTRGREKRLMLSWQGTAERDVAALDKNFLSLVFDLFISHWGMNKAPCMCAHPCDTHITWNINVEPWKMWACLQACVPLNDTGPLRWPAATVPLIPAQVRKWCSSPGVIALWTRNIGCHHDLHLGAVQSGEILLKSFGFQQNLLFQTCIWYVVALL